MPDHIEIDDGNGDHADYLICTPVTGPLLMRDNQIATCCKCNTAIQHRPHAPTAPKKICARCATPHTSNPDSTTLITPRTAAELIAFAHRKRLN